MIRRLSAVRTIAPWLLFIAAVALSPGVASALSTGPNNPGTTANDTTVGTVAWTGTADAVSANDVYALNAGGAAWTSNYLKVTNFLFAIPTDATIDGIVVEVQRFQSNPSNSTTDNAVRIVKGGTIGATDKSAGPAWATSDPNTYVTYGSSTDLWGETWTEADIEASTFGFVVSATGNTNGEHRVDHIRITVYYTEVVIPIAPAWAIPLLLLGALAVLHYQGLLLPAPSRFA